MQSVDVTPSWRGIMPALIAALQAGTAEGQAIAREELGRLAAAVDAANQSGRDAAARAEREAEERAADLARAMQAARAEERAAIAESIPALFVMEGPDACPAERQAWAFDLARLICPDSPLAADWQARATAAYRKAPEERQAARAEAMRGAYAEGRRAALEEARKGAELGEARAAIAAAVAALKAPTYGDSDAAADHAGEAREALESYLKTAPTAPPRRALVAAAIDAAALLDAATSGRGPGLDRGQARATIRDLRAAVASPWADLTPARAALKANRLPDILAETRPGALRRMARDIRAELAALVGAEEEAEGGRA